ncbi:hypothetical protein EVAR_16733_1 [Eumeta japonica]|uniref:Uncharacterized protein n=1 Tax=Eumeta variegata TaxID=151549 RepID=A0A4C1V676_EUMVA|nr:hypothetical protein EVAR_16733_1 [Eumeta japonica]
MLDARCGRLEVVQIEVDNSTPGVVIEASSEYNFDLLISAEVHNNPSDYEGRRVMTSFVCQALPPATDLPR